MDKLSYAWGLAMGRQLQGMGMKELNVVDFKDGVRSVFDVPNRALRLLPRTKLPYIIRDVCLTALYSIQA